MKSQAIDARARVSDAWLSSLPESLPSQEAMLQAWRAMLHLRGLAGDAAAGYMALYVLKEVLRLCDLVLMRAHGLADARHAPSVDDPLLLELFRLVRAYNDVRVDLSIAGHSDVASTEGGAIEAGLKGRSLSSLLKSKLKRTAHGATLRCAACLNHVLIREGSPTADTVDRLRSLAAECFADVGKRAVPWDDTVRIAQALHGPNPIGAPRAAVELALAGRVYPPAESEEQIERLLRQIFNGGPGRPRRSDSRPTLSIGDRPPPRPMPVAQGGSADPLDRADSLQPKQNEYFVDDLRKQTAIRRTQAPAGLWAWTHRHRRRGKVLTRNSKGLRAWRTGSPRHP